MIKLFEKIGKMLNEVAAIVENHEQRITNLEKRLQDTERIYQNPSCVIEGENEDGKETSTEGHEV